MVIAAYWPGLHGPLVFDDQLNITENRAVAIHDLSYSSLKKALLSNNSGPLKRILPALSFGINHYQAGGFKNTLVFKVTNLVIHLISFALAFWLAYLLWPKLFTSTADTSFSTTQKNRILPAFLVALVWALHPIQLTSVTYVVQRMTSMSGASVLLGLCLFVVGRYRLEQNKSAALALMALGIVGGTLLGLMSKENAALLTLYAGVIEYTLFKRHGLNADQRKRLNIFYSLVLLVPVIFGLFYVFVYPGMVAGGQPTLNERLLTEARVLWLYLYMFWVPDITVMGLFHDDILVSTDWITPVTTLSAIFGWLGVLLLAFIGRRKIPVFTFALAWYLVGHSMESSVLPLKLIFEHRNYVPSFAMALLLGYGLFIVAEKSITVARSIVIRSQKSSGNKALPIGPDYQASVLTALVGVLTLSVLFDATYTRAQYWSSEAGFIASAVRNHPYSPSSQYLYGEVMYKRFKNPVKAYPYYFRAGQLEPSEVGFLISLSMVTPVSVIEELRKSTLLKMNDPDHIADLLRTKKISAWGMRALDVASRCVKAQHSSCREHQNDVSKWLNAVVDGANMDLMRRRYFFNLLFDIEMRYRLFGQALLTIKKAIAQYPDNLRMRLMHADVLTALKRYKQAQEVVNNAKKAKLKGSKKVQDALDKFQAALIIKIKNNKK